MKLIKDVLWGTIALVLIAMIFSPPQARADGMPGVRETAREILVEVPKFCRPLKVVWEVQWEEDAINKSAALSFLHADDPKKVTSLNRGIGVAKFQTIWSGGEVPHIQRFDANGRPIKIGFLSILALGGGEKLLNKDNWVFIFADGRVVDISPPVNIGTWGKCT